MGAHLIHVGYAKAGSTILQRWFATHPQIAYSDGAIAGYRTVYDVEARSVPTTADIRLHVTSNEGLSSPRPDAAAVVVDYQALHASDFEGGPLRACDALKTLFPNAMVLIVTRGIRSMILSSYSQYVRSSGDLDLPAFVEQAASRGAWNYDELVAGYRARFGRNNVILLPYELLRDDPATFIRRLEAKLGLDHHPLPNERVNSSLSQTELSWYPAMTRTVRKVPWGSLRRVVLKVYFLTLVKGRLKILSGVLQRLWPRRAVSEDLISDEMLASFIDRMDCLRDEPVYAPFLSEYLIEAAPVVRRTRPLSKAL